MKPKKAKKISLIVTVLNEEETILELLNSIIKQTLWPQEVIITDGGSQDQTVPLIERFIKKHPELNLKLLIKPGSNISQGRNSAIKQAQTPLIAITDAGCRLQPDWLAQLKQTYEQTQAPVVAGYYQGQPQSGFQKAVVPYVLVMPDQVEPTNFLPASRSMLMEKTTWEKLGGFDPNLTVSEDFALAKKIKAQNIKISFAPQAIVNWLPRKNLQNFSWMIFNFAKYDLVAGLIRPKVLLIFARYLIGLLVAFYSLKFWLAGLIFYLLWAIAKNFKYVGSAWYWLPILQITADLAVMLGTLTGALSRIKPSCQSSGNRSS